MNDDILDLPRQEIFDTIGNDAELWVWKAQALLLAAEAVERDCGRGPQEQTLEAVAQWAETHGVSRMLRGMGFECLLKGLWVAVGGTLVAKGKYRGIPRAKDHDLCALEREVAEKVPTGLNDQERAVLARMSFFISYGRYPVRKSVSEPYPSAPNLSGPLHWCRWTPEEMACLESIKNKLFGLADRAIQGQGTST